MMLNKEVRAEQYGAQSYGNKRGKVEFSLELLNSGAVIDRSFLVFQSKNLGNAAFGSRGIARSNDYSLFQAGSSEIRVVDFSGVKSRWSWSAPSSNFALGGQNSERKSSVEIQSGFPTDVESEEGIMNLNAFLGVDNFGIDNENPVNQACSQGVHQAHDYCVNPTSYSETQDCGKTNQQNDGKVNPTGSGAVNVSVLHKSKTTVAKRIQFSSIDTKKGAQS